MSKTYMKQNKMKYDQFLLLFH